MSLDILSGVSESNEVIETFHDFFDAMNILDEIEKKSIVKHHCRNCKTTTNQHEMVVDRKPDNSSRIKVERLFCKDCKIIGYYYSDGINSW